MSPSNPQEKSAKEIVGEECSPIKGEAFADSPGKLLARELNMEEAMVESFSAQVGSFDQREQEEESGFYTLGWDEVYDMRVDTRDIYLICENK